MNVKQWLIAVALAAPALIEAQTMSDPAEIRSVGRATVSVEPERAQVDIGVVTEASEADAAARTNAEKLDAVLRALERTLGPGANLETTGYSLRPNYHRPEPRQEPVLTGYTVSNTVRVKELGLDDVGKVVDVATGAGANSVGNIVFSLRDEAAAKTEALRLAALEARQKAETLAGALGVRIVRVLSASEGEASVVRPRQQRFAMAEMAQAAAPPTPVEPGAIDINASVTLVVEIASIN